MLTLLFYLCLFRFCRVQGKYGILLCQLHVHYMHMHTHTLMYSQNVSGASTGDNQTKLHHVKCGYRE